MRITVGEQEEAHCENLCGREVAAMRTIWSWPIVCLIRPHHARGQVT
jgi:hypothetical protein